MGISTKGYVLIAILIAATGTIPVFAYCPPDCGPKVNYQPGTNGTFSTKNYTSSVLVGNMSSTNTAVTVTTDKASYNDGDKITISGTVKDYLGGTPVSIMIRNPIGNIVYISQQSLGNSTTYSTTISSGGSLWQTAGTYTISVQYGGPERTATTSFDFSGSKQAPTTFPVDGTNFTLAYTITNGKVTNIKADVPSKSLIVSIQSTGEGTLTITLPRALIDAKKMGGADDTFFVLNNDQENDGFQEITTTSTDRTLSIPFSDGTENIQILGTYAVPEFGSIAAMILVIAIVSIVVISRTGLRLPLKN